MGRGRVLYPQENGNLSLFLSGRNREVLCWARRQEL